MNDTLFNSKLTVNHTSFVLNFVIVDWTHTVSFGSENVKLYLIFGEKIKRVVVSEKRFEWI